MISCTHLRCRYHGKRKDSSASTAVSVSTKDEDGIEMEQNIAYGVVETRIGRPNHVDYYEETISFSNECINCNPLPSRIRADAISTLPVCDIWCLCFYGIHSSCFCNNIIQYLCLIIL